MLQAASAVKTGRPGVPSNKQLTYMLERVLQTAIDGPFVSHAFIIGLTYIACTKAGASELPHALSTRVTNKVNALSNAIFLDIFPFSERTWGKRFIVDKIL